MRQHSVAMMLETTNDIGLSFCVCVRGSFIDWSSTLSRSMARCTSPAALQFSSVQRLAAPWMESLLGTRSVGVLGEDISLQ